MGPAIELQNVTKRFPQGNTDREFTAVRDVTVTIQTGEFVALVGPSGCGESTLLNLIAGLEAASFGSVKVEGGEVRKVQTQIGYLFQNDALLPWKTVQENVMLPLIFRREPVVARQAKASEWIARVGLQGFEEYYPHQLSGGMRKRVALAATFVYNPHLLLMDEPFSALDVQTRNLMENELLELCREYTSTIVFVTHDLEEAIALSDRIVVMTASPGMMKSEFTVDLPRPRNVNEIRFDQRFARIHAKIWEELKEEVIRHYWHQLKTR